MATIPELLAWAGAPDALARWAETQPSAEVDLLDLDDAGLGALLRACPEPGWAPWLAAVANVPMTLVASAVGVVIEDEAGGEPTLTKALEEAYAALAAAGTGEACLAAAERCEAIAASPPVTFRSRGNASAQLASATALVLRAAEAIVAVMAREEAERMNRARSQAGRFGGGVSAWVTRGETPVVLAMQPVIGGEPEPPTPELAFAADALGQALEAVAQIRGDRATHEAFVDAL